jgi:hypothetical protein
VEPSSSMAWTNGRPFFRATNETLRGCSLVATSVPKRFAGMRRPRLADVEGSCGRPPAPSARGD